MNRPVNASNASSPRRARRSVDLTRSQKRMVTACVRATADSRADRLAALVPSGHRAAFLRNCCGRRPRCRHATAYFSCWEGPSDRGLHGQPTTWAVVVATTAAPLGDHPSGLGAGNGHLVVRFPLERHLRLRRVADAAARRRHQGPDREHRLRGRDDRRGPDRRPELRLGGHRERGQRQGGRHGDRRRGARDPRLGPARGRAGERAVDRRHARRRSSPTTRRPARRPTRSPPTRPASTPRTTTSRTPSRRWRARRSSRRSTGRWRR